METARQMVRRGLRRSLPVVANETLPAAREAERVVRAAARALGISLLSAGRCASDVPAGAEALLVLGGDGSVLRAVRTHGALGLPMLCVNAGTLGYLSSAPLSGAEALLRAWRDGDCREDARSTLRASVIRGGAAGPRASGREIFALNDLALLRGRTGRVAELSLSVDGTALASFRGDGLVLATATGSTAYSLSAGGPILSPSAEAFVVTPVCPHALSSRPLVLAASSVAEVTASRAEAPVQLSADGELRATLRAGDSVRATVSDRRIRLLRLPGADPFEPLRVKLGWGAAAGRFSTASNS